MTDLRDAIGRIERGTTSYRAARRRQHNARDGSGRSPGTDPDASNDLTDEVPTEARELVQSRPDVREEFDAIVATERGYDDRTGDVAELIAEAANEGKIVDLGSGEYEMEHGITTGEVENKIHVDRDVVGVVGDDATIHYTGTYLDLLFHLDTVRVGALEGVTFDISGTTAEGFESDVGIIAGRFTEAFWARDVALAGRRNRFQDLGSGEKEKVGSRYTWWIDAIEPAATALTENLRLTDGEKPHPDLGKQGDDGSDADHFGGSIAVSTEPTHDGLSVYRNCHVEGFVDNGFYVSFDHDSDAAEATEAIGSTVLWNCNAANVGGGCMRIGENDVIVGGTARMESFPDERSGQALAIDQGENSTVVGLECVGSEYGAELIAIRTSVEETTLDRVVVDADHRLRVIRCDKDDDQEQMPDVTLRDCHVLDRYTGSNSRATAVVRGADVTAENLRIHAAGNDPLQIQSGYDGTLTVDGETYDADADLGGLEFEDPRPLPEYGFED